MFVNENQLKPSESGIIDSSIRELPSIRLIDSLPSIKLLKKVSAFL